MKHTHNTSSSSYWHNNAQQFARFYYNHLIFYPPEIIVKKFLSHRTNILKSLAPVTSKTIMLDLGCGSGEHMKEFIPRCQYVYGIDNSKQMIELGKTELINFPTKKYQLIKADANHLPLSDHSVDIIIAMGLLDYVRFPNQVIAECRRVLRPHGVFVFSMPKDPSIFSFFRTPIGIMIRKKLFHLPPVRNALTSKEVEQLLTDHGFLLKNLTSIWSAMWMIKATRKKSVRLKNFEACFF